LLEREIVAQMVLQFRGGMLGAHAVTEGTSFRKAVYIANKTGG
jgi:hypothetical protein